MNLRITFSAVIVLSVVAVIVTFVVESGTGGEQKIPQEPFFYTLEADDIRHININTDLGETDFTLRPDQRVWYFDDPADIPVNHDRFGGMTFLLAGPRIQRTLQDDVVDEAVFGLENPDLVVNLSLRDGSTIVLEFGDLTPDGEGQYARMVGFPQLKLIDSSWGEVISRLVSEPPFPAWRYTMSPSNVREVLFFQGNDVVRGIARHEDQGWVECDIPIQNEVPCVGSIPIDFNGLEPWLEHIAAPEFEGVAQVARDPDEASAELFGITPDSPYIDIRLEQQQRQGVTEVTHVTLALGDLSSDGSGMFVRAMEQPDIAEVDAVWGKRLLEFFDDRSFVDE